MARGRRNVSNLEALDKQIKAAEEKAAAAKQKYDDAKAELKQLQEKKKAIQTEELASAIAASGRSYEDIMNYLNSDVAAGDGQ